MSLTRIHPAAGFRWPKPQGFRLLLSFNLGYLAWALIGFPELTHVMRFMPMKMTIARLLLRVDRLIARVPLIKTHSWHRVFHFRKQPVQRL